MARSMVGGGDHGVVADGQQGGEHLLGRFVVQDARHHDDFVVRIGFRQVAAQVAGGRQVVGPVQDDPGLLAHRL